VSRATIIAWLACVVAILAMAYAVRAVVDGAASRGATLDAPTSTAPAGGGGGEFCGYDENGCGEFQGY
jgi:hypothetical protein